MGQQQQMLIVLGMLIVGIAIATGIRIYQENSDSLYLSQIENDLVYVATKAQEFYHKPAHLGGGEGSFSNATKKTALDDFLGIDASYTNKKKAYNATFTISKVGKNQTLQIQANGVLRLRDNTLPRYTVTVSGSDYKIIRNR